MLLTAKLLSHCHQYGKALIVGYQYRKYKVFDRVSVMGKHKVWAGMWAGKHFKYMMIVVFLL